MSRNNVDLSDQVLEVCLFRRQMRHRRTVRRDMASLRIDRRFGAAAVTLCAGDLAATFLPELGMVGAALRWRGHELVVLRGGVRRVAARHTSGIPLLHPWANRLAQRRYVAAGVAVDLRRLDLPTDDRGLPMHGTMVGRAGWEVTKATATRQRATLATRFDYGQHPDLLAAFPFPHVVAITAVVTATALALTTTVTATTGQAVPVSFGWHPYLRVPGPRAGWRLRLPASEHLALSRRQIPTGRSQHQATEDEPIGRRTLDDGYALGPDRHFALTGPGVRLDVTFDGGYPFAQVWVPPGTGFACIEPMTAPTNALLTDAYALATPGAPYSATFRLAPG
jgi:galactose mutarotase-like enzyme